LDAEKTASRQIISLGNINRRDRMEHTAPHSSNTNNSNIQMPKILQEVKKDGGKKPNKTISISFLYINQA
jgi:hypothetical protein